MPEFSDASATLPASDMERARAFYAETLGLEAVEENPAGVMYKAGSAHVLVYPSESAGSNTATAVMFTVADAVATVEELRGKGVAFEEYDFPGLKTENGIAEMPGGEKSAWFKDSEGNTLAITQMPG